jgi:hypothetical protein
MHNSFKMLLLFGRGASLLYVDNLQNKSSCVLPLMCQQVNKFVPHVGCVWYSRTPHDAPEDLGGNALLWMMRYRIRLRLVVSMSEHFQAYSQAYLQQMQQNKGSFSFMRKGW